MLLSKSGNNGKTMTDSELRGDCLRIYIDSVSMSVLVNAGAEGLTTALGALPGSMVLPGVGALGGGALGAIIGAMLSGSVGGFTNS